MAQLFKSMDWVDKEDNLTTDLGTDDLGTDDLGTDTPQGSDSPRLPTRVIRGKKYLIVDQSANLRAGSKISVIWEYRLELRSIYTPDFEKYWLCTLCPAQTTLMKVTSGKNSNTTAAIRHLHTRHKISFKKLQKEDKSLPTSVPTSVLTSVPNIAQSLVNASAKVTDKFGALVTRIDAEKFR